LLGQRGLLIYVDLDEADARFEPARRALEGGSHGVARPAPRRPEIDQQRHSSRWRAKRAPSSKRGRPSNNSWWHAPQRPPAASFALGDGALALAFWLSGASPVVGCDIDPRMIARANARATKYKAAIGYAVARAERLPFPDISFDHVTLITVLTFVPEPAFAVREIARLLKPSGSLVIGDLGKCSLWAAARRLRGWLGALMWNAARFRSAGELRALAESAELQVDAICGAVYYPRSGLVARMMAPADPLLGQLTTVGAAFVAVRARKAPIRDVPQTAPVSGV
jgi:SAM-dependent methyltransferase